MPDGAGRAEYESLVGPVDGPGTSRDAAAEVDQAELGADFAAFNQTLVALALDYRPITHPLPPARHAGIDLQVRGLSSDGGRAFALPDARPRGTGRSGRGAR